MSWKRVQAEHVQYLTNQESVNAGEASMGTVFIICGLIGVILGVRGGKFYIGDPDAITSFKRESSTRSGRAVFIIAGVLLIAFGLKFLIVG